MPGSLTSDARSTDSRPPDPPTTVPLGRDPIDGRLDAGAVEIGGTSIVALPGSAVGLPAPELQVRAEVDAGSSGAVAPFDIAQVPKETPSARVPGPSAPFGAPETTMATGAPPASGPPSTSPTPGGRGPTNDDRAACTAAQLRRFVKSRAYVPLHELRRRFGLNGAEDDVSALHVHDQRLFVGLPPREADLLAELLAGGDIGYELLLDPACPLVIGVYPMRPVPRG